MQGKLVLSQSRSTVLFWNRFCMTAPRLPWWRRMLVGILRLPFLLKSEVGGCVSADGDFLRLGFLAFVPCGHGVSAVRNVGDAEGAVRGGFRELAGRNHDDVTRHLRMHVAEQRHYAGFGEFEGLLLALRPGAHIVAFLLVARDRRPENVVLDLVTVQEL